MEKKAVKVYIAPTIEQFRVMTPEQKRVCIAKDVVAAMNNKIYIAEAQMYINTYELAGELYNGDDGFNGMSIGIKDIQRELPKMKECHVCAFGACMLSITKYENRITFADIGKKSNRFTEKADEVVKSVFTPEQLAMIEIMFEGFYRNIEVGNANHVLYGVNGDNYAYNRLGAQVSDEDAIKCILFHRKHEESDDERMRAIMAHIVTNNGDVVPDKM